MQVGRRAREVAALVGLIAGLVLALPAVASAATFTVNNAGDAPDANAGDGDCATAGDVCTLRAAIEEANETTAGDKIKFSSLFDGTVPASEITPGSRLPEVTESLTINGGNCAPSGTAKPCVEIDLSASNIDLGIQAAGFNRVDIRGLAIVGSSGTGLDLGTTVEGSVKGSWIGVGLDGLGDANLSGLNLAGGASYLIGGKTGADRNVIGHNGTGIRIQTPDNRIRGNYLGVLADGATAAPNGTAIFFLGDNRDGNVIGASISSKGRSTAKCDKGCNVIANSTGNGINLSGDNNDTVIKGNFVGLDATGLAQAENNGSFGINASLPSTATGTVIGGDTGAERNFVVGSTNGINVNAKEVDVKRNFVGLNSKGTAVVEPPSDAGIQLNTPFLDGDGLAARNKIAGASSKGIAIDGFNVRLVRNKIGLDKKGNDLDGPGTGVLVEGSDSTVGEPGAGNTVGNTSLQAIRIAGSGDSNVVQGNFLGTDSGGAMHANDGLGIFLDGSEGFVNNNVVGGGAAGENVISNSGDDAIRLASQGGGNLIKRNRGKDNGSGVTHLFIDLQGTDGFGNGSGLNQGLEAPTITNVEPSDVTRKHIEGTGAEPGATIYVFRTKSAAGASPNRINKFVKTTTADGSGDFSTNFSKIPSGQRLTVLQLDLGDGSSELALAVDPVVPPGP